MTESNLLQELQQLRALRTNLIVARLATKPLEINGQPVDIFDNDVERRHAALGIKCRQLLEPFL